MNTSGARRVGWRVVAAMAAVVALLGSPVVAGTAAANDPLPTLTRTASPAWSGVSYVGETVSLTTGTWMPAPTSFQYAWFRNDHPIAGATDSTYTLTDYDQGQTITFTVTANLGGYQPGVFTNNIGYVSGPKILKSIEMDTEPTVVGEPRVGVPLTAQPGVFVPSDVDVRYNWHARDGFHTGTPADNATFTPTAFDIGAPLTFTYVIFDPLYQEYSQTIQLGVVLPTQLSAQPSIGGGQLVGSTLAAYGGWNATPDSVDYQWTNNGIDIAGATSSAYVTQPSDVGDHVDVRMTAHLADLDPLTVTAIAPFIVAVAFSAPPRPTISGSLLAGSTLTAHPGDWGVPGTTFYYLWTVGSQSPQLALENFRLDSSAIGKTVSVVAIGTASGFGPTSSDSSAPTAPIGYAPSPVLTAAIPAVRVHQFVTASYTVRAGDEGVLLSYAWLRNGVAIPGATSQIYQTQFADWGAYLSVAISTANPDFDATPTVSTARLVGEGYMGGAVAITGPVRVGSTVGVQTSGWPEGPITFKYEWVPIYGHGTLIYPPVSASSTYTIPASLRGQRLEVWAKGYESNYLTDPNIWYNSMSVTVLPGLLVTRTAPEITGLPSVGSRLTASRGTISPSSRVTYRYQWFSATSAVATPVAISHATASSYVPTAGLVGHLISVRVTASKTAYSTESTFSAPTRALLPRITVRPISAAPIAHTLR